jgi:hypothetical protein
MLSTIKTLKMGVKSRILSLDRELLVLCPSIYYYVRDQTMLMNLIQKMIVQILGAFYTLA